MAFVNFNHSANFSTALTNSKTSTNTLYFPSDYPTIIKNGKIFGIKSCTGPLSFNASTGVLSHSNSGVTASYYGQSANVSPSHGGTFTIPYINVNATGHITSASNKTITLPNEFHMYTWDIDKNVTFPAKVNATEYLQNNTPLTSIFYNATVSRTKNTVLAAPSTGNGTASFRKLVIDDLPTGKTASTVALGNHTHSNYLTAVTSSNHYKPTETNTIVPETTSSYGSFGTSMYINKISVDDNGHIIYVHGNRLPKNPNTHYTTKLTVGNKASFNNTNTNYTNATYLNVFDDSACRSSISIKGDGSIDTKADASGNLIISSNRYITNSSTKPLLSLSPNETVVCTNTVDSITISTFNTKSNYPIEHYKVVFNTSYSFGNISYNPSLNIKWANNEIPSKTFNILPNKIYEMDFESVTIGGTKTIKGCLTYFG